MAPTSRENAAPVRRFLMDVVACGDTNAVADFLTQLDVVPENFPTRTARRFQRTATMTRTTTHHPTASEPETLGQTTNSVSEGPVDDG